MVKSLAVTRAGSSAIRDLLKLTEQPHVLSLAGGLPHPGSFPVDAIADAASHVLAHHPHAALQYGATEGHGPLREWIAGQSGATTHPDQVLVTSGSQQALDLLTRALVDPGGVVALADPAYVGALQAFRAAGARLAPMPADHHGLRVDALADALHAGLRPTLVYVVANFDNPTGATLDARRRIGLAELAEQYGFWIVEDDPYGALRWRGSPPASMRELTRRTITLGSTSKVLTPGLRIGWAVAPPEVIAAMAVLKQSADLHTSSFDQHVVHHVLTQPGFLDGHLADLRRTYARHAEALADALTTHLGDQLTFTRPDGGMFVWATLADHVAPGVTTTELLTAALDHGVAFVPGRAFSAAGAGGHDRSLRLSYATLGPDDADEAVRRLAAALGSAGTGGQQ